jgi:hypothetical protein
MDFDPFSMVVAIVAISVGAGVVNNYLRMKHGAKRNAVQDEEIGELREDLAKVKDRVRVLEALAVDKDRQLSEEISRLR